MDNRQAICKQAAPAIDACFTWISGQSRLSRDKWLSRFRSPSSSDFEAAVTEACAWEFFASRTSGARLNDKPDTGGVDFEFSSGSTSFLVEATALTIETVTERTGMDHLPTHGRGGSFALLTDAIKSKVTNKSGQVGASRLPTIVWVSTFHFKASVLCFRKHDVEQLLHSTPVISASFDPSTGIGSPPKNVATFRDSLFVAPPKLFDSDGKPVWRTVRDNLSAVVVSPLGLIPGEVAKRTRGVLHPRPARPFEPSLLSDVPFCRFKVWPPTSDLLEYEWIQESPSNPND